jgi:hypothetical protein
MLKNTHRDRVGPCCCRGGINNSLKGSIARIDENYARRNRPFEYVLDSKSLNI